MTFARLLLTLTILSAGASGCDFSEKKSINKHLKVVIIRHGEKPEHGDNLSCQGENRALQIPAILYKKFNQPDYLYVPALKTEKSTSHSRMFQTATPMAIKYNLTINSQFDGNDYADIAKSALKKSGVVLMVWEHSAIPKLADALGVESPPQWADSDFDSIWIITYAHGKASLSIDHEGATPSINCSY